MKILRRCYSLGSEGNDEVGSVSSGHVIAFLCDNSSLCYCV